MKKSKKSPAARGRGDRRRREDAIAVARIHVQPAYAAVLTAAPAIEGKGVFDHVAHTLRASVMHTLAQIDFDAMGGSHG